MYRCLGFPDGLVGKESTGSAGDAGSIPGSGRSPGGGHGNPLQYSCLENPTDRGDWWATVHGVAESDMTEATGQAHRHPPRRAVEAGMNWEIHWD